MHHRYAPATLKPDPVLSPLAHYSYPPPAATLPDIIKHVSKFPALQQPQLLGLHDNAALESNRWHRCFYYRISV